MEKVDYISKEEMQSAIVEYYTTGSKKAYNKIGKALVQIANKLCESSTFNRFPDSIKDNMIGEAICKMITKLNNYDYQTYSNPFAYCTSITFNVFRQHIKKHYKNIERHVSFEAYADANNLILVDNKYLDKIDSHRVKTNNPK